MHGILTAHTIAPNSPIGKKLFGSDGCGMHLFFRCCGRDPQRPLVDGCDFKHVGKRFRMALKRKQGVLIVEYRFDCVLLSKLLVQVANGYTAESVEMMFGEGDVDAQNVTAMTKLLLAISRFENCSLADFPERRRTVPTFLAMLKELKVLARYCARLFEVITMQTAATPHVYMSLAQLCKSDSELAHILFVLFRRNKSAYCPNQHFYNTQIMLRAPYVSLATCQADGIPSFFRVGRPRGAVIRRRAHPHPRPEPRHCGVRNQGLDDDARCRALHGAPYVAAFGQAPWWCGIRRDQPSHHLGQPTRRAESQGCQRLTPFMVMLVSRSE